MISIKNKKGVSLVVASMLLILIVIIVGMIIWGVVSNLVDEQLGDAEACFGVFEKVTFNERYSCYNSSFDLLQISISIADINIDGIVFKVEGEGQTRSFTITNNGAASSEFGNLVANYPNPDFSADIMVLPGSGEGNSGATYVFDVSGILTGAPDIITITPIVNEKQCEVSDNLVQIDPCGSLI